MKLYTALQIGAYHLNHCDDYLITAEIGNDKLLCAVMDGCTMGNDSYFVSAYVGKLLKKIAKAKGYEELYTKVSSNLSLDEVLKGILREVFSGLLQLKSQLLLDQNDLLTTLGILLLDTKKGKAVVLFVGDGVVCINGKITEYDHDNKPDYLGFHLHQDFETWFDQQSQRINIETFEDLSLATDGVTLFSKLNATPTEEAIDPMSYLLADSTDADQEDMLYRKLKKLEHYYGFQPTDDLAVIRLIR